MHVDLGGGIFRVAALDQVRDAAGVLHDFQPAGNLAHGVVQDLAVFGGDDGSEFTLALVQQLAVVEQDLRATGQRGVAPGGERGVGRGDGFPGGRRGGQSHA